MGFRFQVRILKSPSFPLKNGDERGIFQDRKTNGESNRKGVMHLKRADFRQFYRDAHAVECLTEREKMLIGLTVAMMRLCDP